MAEEFAEKTEAPTPRRRQEAREEGIIPRSHDLSSAALLVGLLLLLKWLGVGIIGAMRSVLAEMLSPASLRDVTAGHLSGQLLAAIAQVGLAMAPLLAGALIVGVVANVAQVGFVFNFARLQLNLAALNPMRGLSRLFGGQGAMGLGMDFLKMALVSLAAYSAVADRMGLILSSQQLSFGQIFLLGCQVIFAIALRIGLVLLVLAIIDYVYQRRRVERQLRMSKQEVKEEMRRMDGDPQIKMRRRQIAVQRAMKKLKKEVPTADVVVTNPTHYAVALKYEEKEMHAPRVVAKGADLMAQRIRDLAAEAGIPIVQRPPLARAIFRMVEVGQEIPEQFYAAVAEILAYVYELTGKAKRELPVASS